MPDVISVDPRSGREVAIGVQETFAEEVDRPVTWQDAPAGVLPEALFDDYRSILRRVDGVLRMPGV